MDSFENNMNAPKSVEGGKRTELTRLMTEALEEAKKKGMAFNKPDAEMVKDLCDTWVKNHGDALPDVKVPMLDWGYGKNNENFGARPAIKIE